jgi:hypothetical protein
MLAMTLAERPAPAPDRAARLLRGARRGIAAMARCGLHR